MNSNRVLQYIGLGILSIFFFLYTIGGLYGQEGAYLRVFFVAIIVAAVILLRNIRLLYQYRRYYVWQGLFIFFVFTSCLYTVEPHPLPYVVAMLIILLKVSTVAIICGSFDGVKMLMNCLAFVGVAVFGTLLFQGQLDTVDRLGDDIMGNANSFGLMATVFYTGSLFSVFDTHKKLHKLFFVIAVILDIILILLSGGRKFLLYALVFLFTSLFVKGTIKMKRLLFVSGIAIIVLLVGSYLLMHNSFLYDAIGYRFDGIASGDAEGLDDQTGLMAKGIELFTRKPFFGWGVNGYVYASGTGFYSHSNYVELLANFGLFGTLLYYSNHIWCAIVMWRNRKRKDEEFLLYFPLLISIFVLDIFAITFNQTAYVPLFVMLISGYCLRLSLKNNSITR